MVAMAHYSQSAPCCAFLTACFPGGASTTIRSRPEPSSSAVNLLATAGWLPDAIFELVQERLRLDRTGKEFFRSPQEGILLLQGGPHRGRKKDKRDLGQLRIFLHEPDEVVAILVRH